MSALGDTLKALATVLDKSTIDKRSEGWYVFGAQAVAVRGAPRATQDVDVTVVVPSEALPQLVKELELAGLSHRYPESAGALLASAAVLPLRHSAYISVSNMAP